MNCSDFVAHFTDYLDGTTTPERVAAMESHLAGCSKCRRYKTVVEGGSALLRSLPAPELGEDFVPRLTHRLYHAADERALAAHASSGATALMVLGMAILLTAAAWWPLLWSDSAEVELKPLVVDRPPAPLPVRPANAMPRGNPDAPLSGIDVSLWENTLPYDYSPLSQRYRQRAALRRTGLDRDR